VIARLLTNIYLNRLDHLVSNTGFATTPNRIDRPFCSPALSQLGQPPRASRRRCTSAMVSCNFADSSSTSRRN
jgi:hypothetical protein